MTLPTADLTELLFIRHGHPVSGHRDPSLSAEGRRQAEQVGRRLAVGSIDVVVTSPLARARETAQIAAAQCGLPVSAVIDDLREWEHDDDGGHYVALEDFGEGHPRRQALRTGRYDDFVPPINRVAFRARARRAVDGLVAGWPGRRIAVFSHGGLINAAIATTIGLDDAVFFYVPEYTSISTVWAMPGGRRVVHALNCAAHLLTRHAESVSAQWVSR